MPPGFAFVAKSTVGAHVRPPAAWTHHAAASKLVFVVAMSEPGPSPLNPTRDGDPGNRYGLHPTPSLERPFPHSAEQDRQVQRAGPKAARSGLWPSPFKSLATTSLGTSTPARMRGSVTFPYPRPGRPRDRWHWRRPGQPSVAIEARARTELGWPPRPGPLLSNVPSPRPAAPTDRLRSRLSRPPGR